MKKSLSLSALVLALAAAGHALGATEHELLMKAKKFAEAEKAATTLLAQQPASAQAMADKTDAILGSGRVTRIEEAVALARQCVAAQPNDARCHLAVGKALGTKAIHAGIMSAMGYAGDIRDGFKKAVELEPRNLDARFALLQFYMMAPRIAGGGTGKAETLANETGALNAEASKLMLAKLDIAADKLAKAEAATLAVKPGNDHTLQVEQEGTLASIGYTHLKAKRYADAERLFNEALKRFADSSDVLYGQARVQQEQGKHREALALLEQLIAKVPRPYVHYRIGKSLQALGDKPKAVAAFEKALAARDELPAQLKSDAQDQLKSLKG